MFQVLYAPYEGVEFWRSELVEGSPAVLAYVRPSFARAYLCAEEEKKNIEIPMMEAAAEWLNASPSREFTKLMLRSIKDAGEEVKKPSKLLRTLRYEARFRTRDPRPDKPDGYW